MKLKDIIYDNEYESFRALPEELEINNLTRKIEEINDKTLFFILNSINPIEENTIIDKIKEKNPLAIVCQKDILIENIAPYVLYVENVRKTMAFAYSRYCEIDYEKIKFVAVTGTNGKTTTATILKSILQSEGKKTGFIGTGKIEIDGTVLNEEYYSMTTPDPEILYPAIREMQNQGCEYVVMEASSHALYFDKLAPISFEIGIFTNLSSEHLDFHKNIESYYESKLKLFSICKTGIFNCDDYYGRRAFNLVNCKTISLGILWPGEVTAREIKLKGLEGTEYIYKEKDLIFKARMKLIGAYNIYNSLLALKAAIILGIKPCSAKAALSKIDSIDGRFEITKTDITVIRDYAHTPLAFESLLKTVESLKKPEQNTIVVFGCGGERDKTKRPLMAKIAEKYSTLSIVTNDNPRNEDENEIISDILEGFKKTEKRLVITDRKKAIEYAVLNARKGDVVVLAGKGAENYLIDKTGYRHFSEKTILNETLEKRRENEV